MEKREEKNSNNEKRNSLNIYIPLVVESLNSQFCVCVCVSISCAQFMESDLVAK